MKKLLLLLMILQVLITGIVSAQDDVLTPITAENGAELTLTHTLSDHVMAVSALDFHPLNPDVIVSTSRDLSMRITNLITNETYLETYPHNAVAYGLAISPDGETLLTSSWDRTVRRYRILENYQLDELPAFVGFSHIIDHVKISADGEWIGFGVGDGTVHILDANNYDNRKIFPVGGLVVGDFVFFASDDPKAALFAVAMGFPEDGVLLGNFADDVLFPLEHGHTTGITALATYPNQDGWTLVSAGDDSVIEIRQVSFNDEWEVSENITQINVDGAVWFTTLAFNPAGDVLVAGTQEGDVYVYDVQDIEKPALLTVLTDSGAYPIQTLVFSADGTRLAGGGEAGKVFVWEP